MILTPRPPLHCDREGEKRKDMVPMKDGEQVGPSMPETTFEACAAFRQAVSVLGRQIADRWFVPVVKWLTRIIQGIPHP